MKLALAVTTYYTNDGAGVKRSERAYKCIMKNYKTLRKSLNSAIPVYIGDDCSESEPIAALVHALKGDLPHGMVNLLPTQEPHGVGGSLNRIVRAAGDDTILLYMVDDWMLYQDINIYPWMQALENNESICCLRIGPPHPHTRGTIEAIGDAWNNWAIRLDQSGFAFGHRPALYHPRMFKNHGYFKENCNAFECEAEYADRMNNCAMHDPCIVQAINNPFIHRHTMELADVEREWGK